MRLKLRDPPSIDSNVPSLADTASPTLSSSHLEMVQAHYRDTVDDYRLWSPEGNLHFGYWRWGINPLNRRRMLQEMNEQVFRYLRLGELSGGEIADLGCGVGAASRLGCMKYPKLKFHAMNISPKQISEAQSMGGDERIQYHCADYHQLPWADESLDGAFFIESLCYSLRPELVLGEVARVLKPGARLVLTDGFLMRPLEETSRFFRSIFRCVAENWAVPAYHQINHLADWEQQSGLKCVVQRDLAWHLAPTAFQSVPLTLYCALKLGLRGERKRWRWRQLAASSLSLTLGVQRRNFRYLLLTFEKPADSPGVSRPRLGLTHHCDGGR